MVYAMVDQKLALWEIDGQFSYVEAIEMVKEEIPNTTVLVLIK